MLFLVNDNNGAKGVEEHIDYKGGRKSCCTSYVLAAFGIDASTYHYSAKLAQRIAILRRNGYSVRSRMSKVGWGKTVGKVRRAILAMSDPPGTRYMLRVFYNNTGHAILLNASGETIVDTAPREKDKRQVLAIHAVFPKNAY